jgi:chloramphenicol O-acetyltransferase type A
VHFIDLATWPRRATFEHFAGFQQPWFNVCVRVDCAPLRARVRERGGRLGVALHWLTLALVHRHEAFRLRLHGHGPAAQVVRHDTVHASTTVLRPDDSFGIALLRHAPTWSQFAPAAAEAMDAAARPAPEERTLERAEGSALIYCTTLPWLHFTSFAHAHSLDPARADASVPRFAFGRIDAEGSGPGARAWLPLSVELHHAVADGLHLGRFVSDFEAALRQPEALFDA